MLTTVGALKLPTLSINGKAYTNPLDYLTKLKQNTHQLTANQPIDSATANASTNAATESATSEREKVLEQLKVAIAELDAAQQAHILAKEEYENYIKSLKTKIESATYPLANPTLFASLIPSLRRRNQHHQDIKNQLLQLHLYSKCINSNSPPNLQSLLSNDTNVNPKFSTLPRVLRNPAQTCLAGLKASWNKPIRLFGIIQLPPLIVKFFGLKNTLQTHTEAIDRELQAHNSKLPPYIHTNFPTIAQYHETKKNLSDSHNKIKEINQRQQQALLHLKNIKQKEEQKKIEKRTFLDLKRITQMQKQHALLRHQQQEQASIPASEHTADATTIYDRIFQSLSAIFSILSTPPSPSP